MAKERGLFAPFRAVNYKTAATRATNRHLTTRHLTTETLLWTGTIPRPVLEEKHTHAVRKLNSIAHSDDLDD